MLNINDKIALVVLSNGKNIEDKAKLEKLESILVKMDLVPIFTKYIYKSKFGRRVSPQVRVDELISFYKNKDIKAIFDISGGDLANEVLDYLDYKTICKNNKPFFGYSDLTTVLNGITTKTQQETYLYQIMNIIDNEERCVDFEETLIHNKDNLTDISWQFMQGESIEGIVVGGNIRCFLKLAGTEYFPNLDNKVLFLEGMSTTIEGLITHLTQLKQIGVFNKISGLLLGTFTKIEQNLQNEDIYEILKDFVPENIPIAKTTEVGHSKDSKILVIGQK